MIRPDPMRKYFYIVVEGGLWKISTMKLKKGRVWGYYCVAL